MSSQLRASSKSINLQWNTVVLLTAQHEGAHPSLTVALVTSIGEQTPTPKTLWKNKESLKAPASSHGLRHCGEEICGFWLVIRSKTTGGLFKIVFQIEVMLMNLG